MSKSLSIHVPLYIYPSQVLFSFNEETADIVKLLNEHYEKDIIDDMDLSKLEYPDYNTAGWYIGYYTGIAVIRMRKIPRKVDDFAALQHEINHAITFLLTTRIGMPNTNETTEAFAYMTSYLTEEVYKNLPLFKEKHFDSKIKKPDYCSA
jgi:hypothetical protein